jgi:hypothetical protein
MHYRVKLRLNGFLHWVESIKLKYMYGVMQKFFEQSVDCKKNQLTINNSDFSSTNLDLKWRQGPSVAWNQLIWYMWRTTSKCRQQMKEDKLEKLSTQIF